MSQVTHIIKVAGAWLCLGIGLTLAIFAPQPLAGYLIGASVAFSLLPE